MCKERSRCACFIVFWKLLREEQRLARGWTYEPPTFYEANFVPGDSGIAHGSPVEQCHWVATKTPWTGDSPRIDGPRYLSESWEDSPATAEISVLARD